MGYTAAWPCCSISPRGLVHLWLVVSSEGHCHWYTDKNGLICAGHGILKYAAFTWGYINGFVQNCSISSTLTLKILQSCTKPSVCITIDTWVTICNLQINRYLFFPCIWNATQKYFYVIWWILQVMFSLLLLSICLQEQYRSIQIVVYRVEIHLVWFVCVSAV